MENQKIAVTGAASGIGRAIARACAAAGAAVLMMDRQAEALAAAAADVGARATPVPLDVADEAAVAQAFAEHGAGLTGVVNCAGAAIDRRAMDTDVASFRRLLDVNLIGAFVVSREAVRAMGEAGGAVVNITSVSGLRGNIGRAAYGATKGGLETLTKIMAVELGPRNVRVNAVAPGPIETPMVVEHHTAAMRSGWMKTVPLMRYGQPEEIAQAALFLLDPTRSGYIAGHTICVDGGFCAAGITDAIAD